MENEETLDIYIKELGEKMGELFAEGFIKGAMENLNKEDSKKEEN